MCVKSPGKYQNLFLKVVKSGKLLKKVSFLTYDTANDIIASLEIIEKLLFPETDFWRNNYLKVVKSRKLGLRQK